MKHELKTCPKPFDALCKLLAVHSWDNVCKELTDLELTDALKHKVWANMELGTEEIALLEQAIDRLEGKTPRKKVQDAESELARLRAENARLVGEVEAMTKDDKSWKHIAGKLNSELALSKIDLQRHKDALEKARVALQECKTGRINGGTATDQRGAEVKTKEYWAGRIMVDTGSEFSSFVAIADAIQQDAFEAGRLAGLREAVDRITFNTSNSAQKANEHAERRKKLDHDCGCAPDDMPPH